MGLTGGMFSVYRGLLGLWFLMFFASHLHSSAPALDLFGPLDAVLGFLPQAIAKPLHLYLGCFFSVLFALGKRDRICAWLLILVFPWLSAQTVNPLTPAGFLLVLHLFIKPAPFGSLDALGRVDPGGLWTFSTNYAKVIVLFLASTWLAAPVGLIGLDNWVDGAAAAFGFPTNLPAMAVGLLMIQHVGSVLLAPVTGLRPYLWVGLFVVHLALMFLGAGFGHAPMALLLLLLFQWEWLAPVSEPDLLFYDGSCGMCHRATRFVLAEDTAGTCFQIAPLHGETFEELIPADVAQNLPDSIIIRRSDGTLVDKSRAALLILNHLGGLWRVVAWMGGLIPRVLRDVCYDGVARVRHRFFAKPADVCPILPPHLRSRFRW